MKRFPILRFSALLLALGFFAEVHAGQVAIYTGATQWIQKGLADQQSDICAAKLDAAGIDEIQFKSDLDTLDLADWMSSATGNGELDICVLYGDVPPDLYPQGNTQPDDSVLELFLESEDGDVLINHADYMFWGLNARNSEGGLQNIMDIPTITMWDDNTPMVVTDRGKEIAPSLQDFMSDRPFHLNELAGEWFVEEVLAQNAAGTRADPVIVRDGPRGRLINVFQTADGPEPKGAVAAEIIAYLYGKTFTPAKLGVSGPVVGISTKSAKLKVELRDVMDSPRAGTTALTVNLSSDSATGRFDTSANGPFNGSVTSVTVPAGELSAKFYYKDTAAKDATITAASTGLESASFVLKILENVPTEPGDVAIYTGVTQWISKPLADEQAEICRQKLEIAGIPANVYSSDLDAPSLAEWMQAATGNGLTDVCILYGDTPPDIYPQGNIMPDDSILELFLESTDGDMVINHADYMFWGFNARNSEGGLRNIMDIPTITMWDDNTPMTVTEDGSAISSSLTDFLSDRPFHLDELAGEWFPEVVLASNATGTRADPCIVRDGNRGRLVNVFQTADGPEPKGAVAAEILFWFYGKSFSTPVKLGLNAKRQGSAAGRPLGLTVELQDATGSPRASGGAVTVNLQTTKAKGAFDTQADGPFNGSVKSVSIPAGQTSVAFYYQDPDDGQATITASATGLTGASTDVNIFTAGQSPPGRVAIYTGTTQWIAKGIADSEAQICVDALTNAGFDVTWFQNDFEMPDLAAWMDESTGDGQLDVVVLYGDTPPDIYPQGNTMPDDSTLELFLESTDGDAVMNHADYMFWGLNARNSEGGLRNIMDIPSITMWDDNTPMVVTQKGSEIAPTLTDFQSDRPFHLDELAGDWFDEVILAQNEAGTRSDPCIIRDGPRGRLIPVFQTADGPEPKGQVAFEIISWLLSQGTETLGRPRNVIATGGAKQVSLTWQAPAGGPAPTGYRILRSDAVGGPYAKVADVGASPSTYTDSGLAENTNYCYVVQSMAGADLSGNSNESCARTEGAGGGPKFRRGDVDASNAIDISDPVGILGYLFQGAGTPNCLEAADTDNSGEVDISDAVNSLSYQFLGGPPPAAPGPEICGADSNAPFLGCSQGCP